MSSLRHPLGLAAAALLWAVLPASGPGAGAAERQGFERQGFERQGFVMGTRVSVTAQAETDAQALAATEAALRALEAAEARLSTWTDDSELARFHRVTVGERAPLSPELARELAAAQRCRELTGGAFDPAVGALTRAWGLRSGGRQPAAGEVEAALASGLGGGLEISQAGDGASGRRLHPLVLVDEGGFGKGAGLDAALAAATALPGVRSVTLNLGGQVASRGADLPVTVADPVDRGRSVLEVQLPAGSVATSGNGERGLVVDGERLGHLLDPRTGAPAPDFGSLTVWAPTALEADCLATGLYALGPEAAVAWALERQGQGQAVEVLAVLADGEGGLAALGTPGFAGAVVSAGAEGIRLSLTGTERIRHGDALGGRTLGTREQGADAEGTVAAGPAPVSPQTSEDGVGAPLSKNLGGVYR